MLCIVAPAMKRAMSSTLMRIHKHAVWAALAAARGDVEHAASALGISTQELLIVLDNDPASVWTVAATNVSGLQRRVTRGEVGDEDDPEK